MVEESEKRGETETARIRDAALLRALSTPHKRQKEMKLGKRKRRRERRCRSVARQNPGQNRDDRSNYCGNSRGNRRNWGPP